MEPRVNEMVSKKNALKGNRKPEKRKYKRNNMTENEKREFDHLLGGIKLIIKMHDDTPPHGRFGLPQFQMEAVAALVKQLEAQEKEVNQLKVEIDLLASLRSVADTSAENWKAEAFSQEERANDLEKERDDLKAINTWLEARSLKEATSPVTPKESA